MAIKISILNTTGKLTEHISLIKNQIQLSLNKINEYFDLVDVDITVSPFQKGEESPSGIGGYALSPHRVELLLDCQRVDVVKVIESELLDVLAHELHHSLRMNLCSPLETLGDHLILEGQACHFEHTITRGKKSLLFEGLENHDWKEILEKMKPHLDSSDYSHNKFFHGSNPSEFPKYAGYWVGFNLVSEYIKINQLTDSKIIGLDSKKFIPAKL